MTMNSNNNKHKGLFITFEGGEGSGKTTIMNMIISKLSELNFDIIQTREPGGVKISEDIRNIILNKANTSMDCKTEALLYAASRRQHLIEKVWPALKENKIVICDRYLDSSLVYQGVARNIGINNVLEVNRFAIDNTFPDLTILFDIEPEVGLARIESNSKREVNRLDLESLSFHKKVREGYLEVASIFKDRIKIVDASKSIEEVYEDVLNLILNLVSSSNQN